MTSVAVGGNGMLRALALVGAALKRQREALVAKEGPGAVPSPEAIEACLVESLVACSGKMQLVDKLLPRLRAGVRHRHRACSE